MTLLQMSFSGALMILVIAGFRFLLQRKVHRNVWIFLWLTTVLRLLIPFSLPAATSFYNLPIFHAAHAAPQAVASAGSLSTVAPFLPAPSIDPITAVWLIGAALILLIVISNHLYHLWCYKFSLPCTASLPPMPKGVQVRTLENLDAPLTYGILKPTILLPSDFPMEDGKRLGHVLQHELSHILNRDILTKLLLIVTAAIHWFNPFVWLMLGLANQDMEMRCDAQAVTKLGNERIAYARSLIAAEEDRLYGILQAGFAHSATERRILALTKDRAAPVLSGVVCVVTLLLLGAVFMTGQAGASQNEILPPASVVELQETIPEVIPEPQDEEITISSEETAELPEAEMDEVTDEEVLPEEPATEEEPTEAQTEEAITEAEVPTESEETAQEQSTYSPPAPSPEPYIEPPELDFTLPELPNNYYADTKPSPIPSTNYDNQSMFPVIEIYPDPGPQSPLLQPSTPGPQPCIPGISFP